MKRWLSLALVLVLVMSFVPFNILAIQIDGPIKAYFVPNASWKADGAWFAAYCWKNSTDTHWVELTREGLFYTAEIPSGYTNIIFTRMDPSKTELSWDSKSAQTVDLALSSSKPVFVLDAGTDNKSSAGAGTWITYPASCDYYLAGYLNGVDVGVSGAANQTAYKFADNAVTATFTADSYVCVGVQSGSTVLGNYMSASYVSSGNTAVMYANGVDKLLVPAGTYTFTLTHNTDGSVTLGYRCVHNMTYHEAEAATCTAPGTVAYYFCDRCGKNFADEAGTTELTEVSVGRLGHGLVYQHGYEESCVSGGVREHYYCVNCGKSFADADAEVELTDEEVLIPPTGLHNYENGFCANNADGAICGAYEPAVLVTADNRAGLGLSESYIGYYAIGNAGQLYWFADKVNYENGNVYWSGGEADSENYGDANAVLTKDITVNEGTVTAESTGLRTWDSMGFAFTYDGMMGHIYMYDVSYRGIFDGNGKTISGLYCTSGGGAPMDVTPQNSQFVGFIGNLRGKVQNLTIANSYFDGSTAGCVVGWNRGTVTNCFSAAAAVGYSYAGGIAGANTGLVERCGNSGYVEERYAYNDQYGGGGGIVGQNVGAVRNCWNTGTVSTGNNSAGGIVGKQVPYVDVWYSQQTSDDMRIENCWSVCELFCGNNGTGAGIVGWLGSEAVVDNCYSDWDTLIWHTDTDDGTPTVTDVERKTAEQFASGQVAYLLQKDQTTQVWGQNIDNGQPVQTVPVFSAAKVYYVPVDCAGRVAYTNYGDIDPHHYDDNGFCDNENAEGGLCDAYEPAVLVTNENYTGLGLTADYVGYYAITNAGNLYWFAEKVDSENDTYKSANVVLTKDITVNSGTVTADSAGLREWNPIGYREVIEVGAGSIIDYGFSGIFDGNGKTVSGLYFNDDEANYVGLITVTGTDALVKDVTLTNSYLSGKADVGGIVGDNKGTVTACINNATIVGSGTVAGGIVGHNSGSITDCVNHAAISALNHVGGISGANYGTVELCGNAGTVTATGGSAGGVVGENYSAVIRDCWNSADVSGTNNVGGIVGRVAAINVVENCWSAGTVTVAAGDGFGGLVGYFDGSATVQNCYTAMTPAVGPKFRFINDPVLVHVEIKTLDQFASGEVAYLLRTRAVGTNVWGQDLDNGKEVQTVPTFTGADVYYGYTSCADTEAKYTNDPNVSATPIPHNWDYTADGASTTGTCLNECGVDGGRVTLVLDGSTVYDGTEKVVAAEGALTGIATLPAVTYEGNRVNIGTFTAYLTLEDGTQAKLEVTITAKELTPTVEGLEDSYEYTGETIKPEITVKDGDKVLVEGTDYDVTYDENTNVGEGTVTVTLKGGYEGQLKQTFDITPKPVTPTIEGLEDSSAYTGEAIKPEITVKDGDKVLVEGTDYDVTYGENTNVGEGTVTVTMKGGYEGQLKQTFDITPKSITPTIEGVKDSYTYTGEAIKPEITVKDGDKVLTEGADYDVTYGDNKNVGEGTVTVTMKGNYSGSAEETFTITARVVIPGTDSPNTGDTANVALWSGIALISLAAAAALVLGKKRFTV